MKKVFFSFSVMLLAAMVMVGCNKNSPKDVAYTWLTDVYHMDYSAAMKMSTDDTKNILGQLQQLKSMLADSLVKENQKITVTIKDVKEDGDKATVSYMLSDNKDKVLTTNLVKQNNVWLVQFSKTDGLGLDDTSADQTGADSTSQGAPPADTSMADTMKH